MDALVEHSVDVNLETAGGDTPLIVAVSNNQIEPLLCLVSHGANPEHETIRNEKAIILAAERGAS